jgi:hypothetical protein
MTRSVSFHKHEVVGANKTREMLTRLGYPAEVVEDVAILVRHHQFRFYPDTKDETIQKWMRKLGKNSSGQERWKLVMLLRLLDRGGNDKNKNKPLITKAWNELYEKCHKLNQDLQTTKRQNPRGSK